MIGISWENTLFVLMYINKCGYKIRRRNHKMTKSKTNSELWEYYINGNYDELSLDELKMIEALVKVRGATKKVEEPTDKLEIQLQGERKQVYNDNDETGKLISWAKENSLMDYSHMWENTDADAACPTDYSDWSPSEFYSNFILHAVAADTPLLDLVKMKVDVSAGNGDTVRFRHISSRSAQVVGSGECMSCCSNSITKTDITIGRYGDYTILNEFELWQSKDVKEEVVKSMSIGASRYVNAEIHDAITEATPGYNVDMSACFTKCSASLTGSCCTEPNGYNFYVAAVDLVANMTVAGYNDLKKNGCWLIHPDVAAFLKYPSGTDIPYWMRGSTDVQDGELVKLLGIEVREDPLGTACSTCTNTPFAYLINKQRSIGLAWGKRPVFNYKYSGKCDSWDITYNSYFGVNSIEDSSIGTISSPDA